MGFVQFDLYPAESGYHAIEFQGLVCNAVTVTFSIFKRGPISNAKNADVIVNAVL